MADPVTKKLLACLTPFSAKKVIVPDDNLELDLGLDSLARVELVVSIEKSFDLSLPDSFGSEVFTVKDAATKIRELLASGPVAGGQGITMTWADILSREPSEDLKGQLELDSGPLCSGGRHMLTLMLRCFLSAYGRLSIRGTENLPKKGPFIIAPNHLSLADAPAVMCTLPWTITAQTFFLGTTDFFGGPVTSRIAKLLHVIPVDMETRLSSAMQLSAHVLRRGKVLCVFPEGGRSRDGRIKEFKKGVGIIARELNIPVVPAAIRGTYDMLPTGGKLPKPAKVSVSFGRPIYPEGRDYDEIVKKLYEEVVKLQEEGK
jgi:long-chain acyl-CoA synthetase